MGKIVSALRRRKAQFN